MIIKLLFILIIIFLIKLFIIRFDYHDYYIVTCTILLILFGYLFLIYNNIIFSLIIVFISLSIIIYSYFFNNSNNTSIVFINGNIMFKNIKRLNYSVIDLFKELRKNNISIIDKDICGIIENNKLFFYLKENVSNKPVPIIINGVICINELKMIGKDSFWINKYIDKKNILLKDIFYSFYYNNKIYIIKK